MTETKTAKRPARKADPTAAVLAEVKGTRKLLGFPRMPVAGGRRPEKGRAYFLRQANRWRSVSTARDLADVPGWDAKLLAEAFGTLAETEPVPTRAGLVRLAALTVAAIESIDEEAAGA